MLATFWVTTDCNMKCHYCYEGHEKPQKKMVKETSDKAIEFVINHFNKLGDDTLIINFHGGEPLLQFDLIKYVVAEIKKHFHDTNKNIMFGLTTNGILLNEEIESYLCDNFQYSLSLSIDGTKLTHDKYRVLNDGRGTYDLVINKFMRILQKKPDVRARMTFNSSTVSDLYMNVKHLVGLGFTTIVPVPDYFDKNWDMEKIKILYKQLEKISEILKENPMLRIGMVDSLNIKIKGKCSGGKSTINIDPDGNIYPCTYTVGNDFFQIGHIDKGIMSEKLNEIDKLSEIKNKDCLGCTYSKLCTGTRCKLVNKVITGDFHTPPAILCLIENINYKLHKLSLKV